MRQLITFEVQFLSKILKQIVLVTGLGTCFTCGVLADDIVVSEQTFSCILDWPKVRNTHIKNDDPEKLKEAIRIFRDSVPNTEYPVGTILQLIPSEAMIKHPRGTFAKTNDWEFFSLDLSATGTKISERGDNVINHLQGVTCLILKLGDDNSLCGPRAARLIPKSLSHFNTMAVPSSGSERGQMSRGLRGLV